MKSQKGSTDASAIVGLFYLALILAVGIGWCMDIAKIANSSFDHVTPLLVLRLVGIFFVPLGSFLGYWF
jgi:hypothetical protein